MLIGHFKQAVQPLHLFCPPDHCTITPLSLSRSLWLPSSSNPHDMPKFQLLVCGLFHFICLLSCPDLGWFIRRGFACALCKPSTRHSPHPQTAVSANTDAVSGKIPGLCVSSSQKKTNAYIATSKSQRQGPYWERPIIENMFANIRRNNNRQATIDDGAAKNR